MSLAVLGWRAVEKAFPPSGWSMDRLSNAKRFAIYVLVFPSRNRGQVHFNAVRKRETHRVSEMFFSKRYDILWPRSHELRPAGIGIHKFVGAVGGFNAFSVRTGHAVGQKCLAKGTVIACVIEKLCETDFLTQIVPAFPVGITNGVDICTTFKCIKCCINPDLPLSNGNSS